MERIEKATAQDREDVIDFINYVFSQAHVPHDFKTLIPKAYGDRLPELGAEHYLIRENGRIKALVANRPTTLSVAGHLLQFGCIGSVSVHLYARGKGYMKALMQEAMREAKESGADLLALGGQRQRYGYFGFEPAGVRYCFLVTSTNLRHVCRDIDCSGITFEEIAPSSGEAIRYALSLYEKRPMHAMRRPEEFCATLTGNGAEFLLIRKNGEPLGYCSGKINELVLEREEELPAVLKAFFQRNGLESVTLSVSPFETERARYLDSICEECSIRQGGMVRVLNWQRVLQAYLELKASYARLEDGCVEFSVEGEGYRITVQGGRPLVERIPPAPCAPSYSLREAQRLFFSLRPLLLVSDPLFQNWLPLPYLLDGPDHF